MKHPIIGILGTRIPISFESPFVQFERDCTNSAYIGAVESAGGIPLMIPVSTRLSKEYLEIQLSFCNGLLIPGGYDIDPTLYGEDHHPLLELTNRHCDDHHLLAIKIAQDIGLPILGICRGMQILNVSRGGSLWQDVSLSRIQEKSPLLKHKQFESCDEGCHDVLVTQDSELSRIFPNSFLKLNVNSLHHQAVRSIGKGLTMSAIATDGIIEGIEDVNEDSMWIVGVQWHPEVMLSNVKSRMDLLFKAFIKRATARKPRLRQSMD